MLKIKIPRSKIVPSVKATLALGGSMIVLTMVTLVIGKYSTAFTGFPKGWDSFDHLAIVKMIRDDFPRVFWNPYWDEGIMMYPRHDPSLYHFILAFLSGSFKLEIPQLVIFFSEVSFVLTSIFIFLITFRLIKKIIPGLVAGLFFLSSSIVWATLITFGLYPRVFSLMVFASSLYLMILSLEQKQNNSKSLPSLYPALLLLWVLVFLSDFLEIILLLVVSTFLIWVYLPTIKKRLKTLVFLVLPVVLLSAFFYLPMLVYNFWRLGLVKNYQGIEYEPLKVLSLFKQGYPGLPFLSVPLGIFLFLAIFLLRKKVGKSPAFWPFFVFGLLSFFCLLYFLGFYRHDLFGIYPEHFLLPAVFFLSLFIGLGLGLLAKVGVLSIFSQIVIVIGLGALALNQANLIKVKAIDQSRSWRAINFQTVDVDDGQIYRFAHHDEVLGGAFNYYSSALQTYGYGFGGALNSDFNDWFEEGIFKNSSNPKEREFLLDFLAVKGLYLGKEPLMIDEFDSGNFVLSGTGEYEYRLARPLLWATNAPVLVSNKNGEEYLNFLKTLASEGKDSRFLIPLRGSLPAEIRLSAVEIDSPKKAVEISEKNVDNQKPVFVNNQTREINLTKKFTGVLLKENYFPNWQVKIQTDRLSQKLPILVAGPGMMYTPLPDQYDLPAKVIFEYKSGWSEKLGIAISSVSLLSLLVMLVVSKTRRYKGKKWPWEK